MKNEIFNKKTQKMAKSLGAVHTHTHTHTCSFISKKMKNKIYPKR